jgi:hypothetical protein
MWILAEEGASGQEFFMDRIYRIFFKINRIDLVNPEKSCKSCP